MLKSILLVEDDPDDREFFQDALATISKDFDLAMAKNGIEALITAVGLPGEGALLAFIFRRKLLGQ